MKQCLPIRLLPLLAFNFFFACGRPSYPADRLPEAVVDLCRKELKIDVTSKLVGRTLYIVCDLKGLVTNDLDFQEEAMKTFEDLMLAGTRAALSTDATVDFLAVEAQDPRLDASITILRYIPDIKGLIYMRYSRSDFENRMVLESNAGDKNDAILWHDVSMPEFMARLVASRLQRRLMGNPLVSALLQVRAIDGRASSGTIHLSLRGKDKTTSDDVVDNILKVAIDEVVGDVLRKYDTDTNFIRRVVLEDEKKHVLWEQDTSRLIDKTSPKLK